MIQRVDGLFDPILQNKEMAYAWKNRQDGGLVFTGNVKCDHLRAGQLLSGGWEPKPNVFTTEGLARLLNIMFGDVSKAASKIWYVGIFKNNVTPAASDTAAAALGAAGTYGECQDADYDSPATNKPSYNTATTTTGVITNSANAATFTMDASITVYGAFLSTETAKTATSGYLMCAKRFTSSRAVVADDQLAITYQITCTSS